MSNVWIGVAIALVSFLVGYWQGSRNTRRKILDALGVKSGYRITGVSFEKSK